MQKIRKTVHTTLISCFYIVCFTLLIVFIKAIDLAEQDSVKNEMGIVM